jgi:hypothetical protein
MQNSLASSPLLPLGVAAAAVVIIAGSFTNGDITGGDNPALASSASSADAPAPAEAPAPAPAPATSTAAASGTQVKAGKSVKINGVTVELGKSATKKGVEVTVGKKTETIAQGKSGAFGKHTVTVDKIDKQGDATVEVK